MRCLRWPGVQAVVVHESLPERRTTHRALAADREEGKSRQGRAPAASMITRLPVCLRACILASARQPGSPVPARSDGPPWIDGFHHHPCPPRTHSELRASGSFAGAKYGEVLVALGCLKACTDLCTYAFRKPVCSTGWEYMYTPYLVGCGEPHAPARSAHENNRLTAWDTLSICQ